MRVYEVWTTDDEYRSSCKAICDSVDAALEFAKTKYDWFDPRTVYENIMANGGPKKDWHIRETELVTMATLAQQKMK